MVWVPVVFKKLRLKFANSKNKPRIGENYTCFGCKTKTGEVRILGSFQDRNMYSALSFKRSEREISIDVSEHRGGAFDSAKNHKRQRRKRQSVRNRQTRNVANAKVRIG